MQCSELQPGLLAVRPRATAPTLLSLRFLSYEVEVITTHGRSNKWGCSHLFPFSFLLWISLTSTDHFTILAAEPSFPRILPAAAWPPSLEGDSGFATLCLWPAVGQLP